jgi:alpha-galactosidase
MKKKMMYLLLFVLQGFAAIAWSQPAEKPPMGWNSYNCYGATVNEAEVKANADMMAVYLKDFGWEYIVIDYCWFYPQVGALNNPPQTPDFKPNLAMDRFGRLIPVVDRFPSSANGKGFKPLADYVHSKGLKFGIHVMRGIPRQAVAWKTPVLGTNVIAGDIADTTASTCDWLNHMHGLDKTKSGAQQYYDSIIRLYSDWGVDYIKVDDMIAPVYYSWDVEAIRKAIDRCGRSMVFSLSPGNDVPVEHASHLQQHANLWRISADFWDEWPQLKKQFDICAIWAPLSGPGHWADADMLQIGRLSRRGPNGFERDSRFTKDEQRTHITLWAIFRSPLMMGGDLTMLYPFTLSLLRNKQVLSVNQNSTNNRQLFRRGNHVAWAADIPDSKDKYLAVFNLGEDVETPVYVLLADLGISGECRIADLWSHENLGEFKKDFAPLLPAHGAGLYRISMK